MRRSRFNFVTRSCQLQKITSSTPADAKFWTNCSFQKEALYNQRAHLKISVLADNVRQRETCSLCAQCRESSARKLEYESTINNKLVVLLHTQVIIRGDLKQYLRSRLRTYKYCWLQSADVPYLGSTLRWTTWERILITVLRRIETNSTNISHNVKTFWHTL